MQKIRCCFEVVIKQRTVYIENQMVLKWLYREFEVIRETNKYYLKYREPSGI